MEKFNAIWQLLPDSILSTAEHASYLLLYKFFLIRHPFLPPLLLDYEDRIILVLAQWS